MLNKTITYRCFLPFSFFISFSVLLTSCGSGPKESATAQSQGANSGELAGGAIPVDVAIARLERLESLPEFTGTTLPVKIVSLRSQVEGKLLALSVDVGDRVARGRIIGQLDDTLLRTALNQAEAELLTRQSEVARAKSLVSNARTEVEKARLELVQAQQDAQRQQKLLKEGAIPQQTAEQTLTEAKTANQALRAALEQVRSEEQAVAAASGRVVAQKAVVEQARERRAYASLVSPISGVIAERVTEPGNLLQPGGEVLKIADFSQVKVIVQVSELELSNIRTGQTVQVRLDAFPNQTLTGRISRISPVADSTARLVPVEIVIPNSNGRIGSGLLARVTFQAQTKARVVIPQVALGGEGKKQANPIQNQKSKIQNPQGRIFVLKESSGKPTVTERSVILGEKKDSQVEVISGLQPGERYVVRSGRPLKEGSEVRLSILSEKQ